MNKDLELKIETFGTSAYTYCGIRLETASKVVWFQSLDEMARRTTYPEFNCTLVNDDVMKMSYISAKPL